MDETTRDEKRPRSIVDVSGKSLIWIALIVTVCSGSEQNADRKTRNEIRELSATVERLEKKVDALTKAAPAAVPAPAR